MAIIGILAAFAIPAYQDCMLRMQAAHAGHRGTEACGTGEDNGHRGRADGFAVGQLTCDSPGLGLVSGKYVASVPVLGGAIVITYGGQASSELLGKDPC